MERFYLTGVVVLILSTVGLAQGPQSEFLEAKRLYRAGDYRSAQSAFSSLYRDPTFGTYATFYAGLSSYELGEKSSALSIWRQILTTDSQWDQIGEVYYWMILTNYELEEFGEAIRLSKQYASRGGEEVTSTMAAQYLAQADLATLKGLYVRFTDFPPLGRMLAQRLSVEDPNDIEAIRDLISKFDLDPNEFSKVGKANVRKDDYSVAVLFPFLFDGLDDPGRAMNNRVVMEIYQGLVLAANDLKAAGRNVTLYPYDTRRSADATRKLLSKEGIANADLILGPLFPGPNYVVDSFARVHQINMVNPVSTNSDVIGSNPFSFLLKPSNETIARELADFTADRYNGRGALIYFAETPQDTTFARAYRERLEEREIEVLQYRSVDIKTSKALLDSLIDKEDIILETTKQVDSVRSAPHSILKSRRPKPTIPSERDYPSDTTIYYETKITVLQDSIGHIAVISSDNSIINSFIGVVETRADTMGLVGYGNWMELSAVDYDQLERLGVSLAYPEFVDKRSEAYRSLMLRMQEACDCLPSMYHILGYEGLYFLGTMLHKHGKYFQNGWISEGPVPGHVFTGFDFGLHRDNQVVPIIGLNNLELQPVSTANDQE